MGAASVGGRRSARCAARRKQKPFHECTGKPAHFGPSEHLSRYGRASRSFWCTSQLTMPVRRSASFSASMLTCGPPRQPEPRASAWHCRAASGRASGQAFFARSTPLLPTGIIARYFLLCMVVNIQIWVYGNFLKMYADGQRHSMFSTTIMGGGSGVGKHHKVFFPPYLQWGSVTK